MTPAPWPGGDYGGKENKMMSARFFGIALVLGLLATGCAFAPPPAPATNAPPLEGYLTDPSTLEWAWQDTGLEKVYAGPDNCNTAWCIVYKDPNDQVMAMAWLDSEHETTAVAVAMGPQLTDKRIVAALLQVLGTGGAPPIVLDWIANQIDHGNYPSEADFGGLVVYMSLTQDGSVVMAKVSVR